MPDSPEHVALERLHRLEIELPSWGFADTGTRFGKFLQDSAALTLEDKLDDAAEVNRVTGCCPSVAVHVLWDFEDLDDPGPSAERAAERGLRIGSINPNVFQDQCYRLGSVTNEDASIRRRAIDHLLQSVEIGKAVGSDLLSLWFADGTNYPGQGHLRRRKRYFTEALKEVHDAMPESMTMLVEYKPFEPAFYHTDIADWGMAAAFARSAGPQAKVLVDTGHHLPGQNIEHIVAFLADEGMLGGFHFNDRHYADDDLTVGSIDPYRIFRIFLEILQAERDAGGDLPIAYMVDQSHNLKPKVEAMIQTVDMVQQLFAKAALVDLAVLDDARSDGDVVVAEECLKSAFATDVRPLLAEWRSDRGLPTDPLADHRASGYAARAAEDRRPRKPSAGSSYA
ncbi:MAG: TIM barrel protein [Phycisphaerales bacterium]|nr:TIM barrel protein [Phycisphaerales bacterium]